MNSSPSMLVLVSGFWVLLLIGCGLFAIIALRQRRRAERAEQQLRELADSIVTPASASDSSDSPDAGKAQALGLELDALKQGHEEALARNAALGAQMQEMERTNAEQQGSIKALETERNMLDRQLKNLSAGLEAGDKDTMREMIVNFTEESRELLVAIEAMGKEKAELLQKIADMEAEGKGTAGTVIGLKRKLEHAEVQIQQLEQAKR